MTTTPASVKLKDYKVQFVAATGGYVPPLYLIRASTPAVLDATAKGLINSGQVIAKDYMSGEIKGVPSIVLLGDGGTLKMGVELTYDSDLAKVDWAALWPGNKTI